jgi:DNA helicase-2/ATP-dependent DNA helicase PcrA
VQPKPLAVRLSAYEELARSAPASPEADARLPALGPDDVLTVSYSQIADYQACPLRYRFAHVLQIPTLPTPQLVYGDALHRAVHDYLQKKVEGLQPTFDDLERTFRATWLSEGFISTEHEAERFEAGLEALRRFDEEEQQKPAPEMVEQRFSFMLGRDRVVGRWDRVDRTPQGAVVIDHKSTAEVDSEAAQRKATSNLQLLVYALAYERMYGEPPAKVALHFLESGERGEIQPSADAVGAVRAQITAIAGKIRQRDFKATPDRKTCDQCAFSRICPESFAVRAAAGTGL